MALQFKLFNAAPFSKLRNQIPGLKTQTAMIFLAVIFMMLSGNLALFRGILHVYPLSIANLPFLLSLASFFSILTALFFLVICFGRATRWILAGFLLIVALSAYYMDHFGIIIDTVMLDNVLQTDVREVSGLLTFGLVWRTLVLGVLPAWIVIRYCPTSRGWKTELRTRLKYIALLLAVLIVLVVPFTAGYASFIREHKIVRFYANPTYPAYSVIKSMSLHLHATKKFILRHIAGDAHFVDPDESKRELIIMVVGETARADRFSLNGYPKPTNPLLSKEAVVSFSQVRSCGTSTGVSVPCMFSSLGRKNYDKDKALEQEDALDVLTDHGVQVLWRDNNSDSKGVATRVQYEDFKTPTLNPVCDDECRDIGMLSGLDRYIASKKDHDILIVLHQMGNHGPEYYRRYPKAFERFKPACQTGELSQCSQQEIDNAYDNAILYTDYFLSETIRFLKKYDDRYETAMLYVADHGESLGEHGIYLHAAPYIIAPEEQVHIPAIAWVGQNFDYDLNQIKPYRDYPLSHDDLFCTLLIAYELDAKMCEAKKSLLLENHHLLQKSPPQKPRTKSRHPSPRKQSPEADTATAPIAVSNSDRRSAATAGKNAGTA